MTPILNGYTMKQIKKLLIAALVFSGLTMHTMSIWNGAGAINYEAYKKGSVCESWLQAETIRVSMLKVNLSSDYEIQARTDFFEALTNFCACYVATSNAKEVLSSLIAYDNALQTGLGWTMTEYTAHIEPAQQIYLDKFYAMTIALDKLTTAHGLFLAVFTTPEMNMLEAMRRLSLNTSLIDNDSKDLRDHATILLTFAKICIDSCARKA